jgi:hypothetical protein
MSDDQLVPLHQRPEDLTEEAKAALASELSRRNIRDFQIREKQSQWQSDAEEERQRVVASRKAYVRRRLESLTQLGVILAVGIAYMVAVLYLTEARGEVVGKLMMTVAVVIWRLVRAFAPDWRVYWTAPVALAGYILATVWIVMK